MPLPVSWLSPCDAPLSYPANCFVWLFASNVAHVVPTIEAQPDRISDVCTTHPFPSERGVLGCIYGLSQAFFATFEVTVHLLNRAAGAAATADEVSSACATSLATFPRQFCGVIQRELPHGGLPRGALDAPSTRALALWCDRFALSSSLGGPRAVVQVQRWKACVAGAMHRIGLDALIFDIPAAPVMRLCAGLEVSQGARGGGGARVTDRCLSAALLARPFRTEPTWQRQPLTLCTCPPTGVCRREARGSGACGGAAALRADGRRPTRGESDELGRVLDLRR